MRRMPRPEPGKRHRSILHIGEIRRLNQRKLLFFGDIVQARRHAGAGVGNVTASRGCFVHPRAGLLSVADQDLVAIRADLGTVLLKAR
jgi:hypothetical protein